MLPLEFNLYAHLSSHLMEFIEVQNRQIAVINDCPDAGAGKGIMWIGGFASTMEGTKASYLAAWAKAEKANFLRFDYSGCGASAGDFYDGRISTWNKEGEAVFGQFAKARQIVIASSMGAWVAWSFAERYAAQIAALILIAPAPDFTARLIGEKTKARLAAVGTLPLDDPSGPLSHKFVEDGNQELVLDKKLHLSCPVHIFHGLSDSVVSLSHALEVVEQIEAPEVQLILIKGCDHSLSDPKQLAQLKEKVAALYFAL